MTKLCKKCGVEKPLSEFHQDKRAGDGHSQKCLSCHDEIRAEQKSRAGKEYYKRHGHKRHAATRAAWHDRNPDKKFEYHKKKYETVEGRAMHLFNGAKSRVPLGFSLTLSHVTNQIGKGHCAVTGIKFDLRINQNGKRSRSWSPYAPSLDKIDSRKPYTDENTRVVIWQYNVMKGELSDDQVFEICKLIVTVRAS